MSGTNEGVDDTDKSWSSQTSFNNRLSRVYDVTDDPSEEITSKIFIKEISRITLLVTTGDFTRRTRKSRAQFRFQPSVRGVQTKAIRELINQTVVQ